MVKRQNFAEPAGGASSVGQSLLDLHVLVVDDHEDIRELMGFVLERAGAKVTLAESASLALSAMAKTDFGVLISDIGMPEQDGYDLIRQLRTSEGSPSWRHIPAVAVTAFTSPEDRRKALAAGFQEHLPKPVDPVKLVAVVARLAAPNAV
jgi:CheY-like chemotaxis protein